MESDPPPPPKRSLKQFLYLYFTGICMGAADVVPGVSGGTMAFIMGIYEELLDAIKSFNVKLIKLVLGFKVKAVLTHIPFPFLIVLLAGIGTSVVLLVKTIEKLLNDYDGNGRAFLFAFFFGLVVASIIVLARRVKWSSRTGVAFVIAAIISFLICLQTPAQTPSTQVVVFFSGMVAICAMILPGISGSFILLILGQYDHIMGSIDAFIDALKEMNLGELGSLLLGTILPFAVGAAIGLLAFARILSWLLHRWHMVTLATLTGLMTGSLVKIYPFKEVLGWGMDRHGDQYPVKEAFLAPAFDATCWTALGLAVAGFILILVIEVIQAKVMPSEA
ncbi:MAG: putative membrane protein [Kiritimatiellia bacterium]|jgi:putative membrane protein